MRECGPCMPTSPSPAGHSLELIELRHAPHESRLPSDHQTVLHREAEHTVGHCRGRQVCGHLVLEQDQVEAPRG